MSIELPPMQTILDDGDEQLGAKVPMALFAEKHASREPLYFPMTTASVLLNQICADWLVIMTDLVW